LHSLKLQFESVHDYLRCGEFNLDRGGIQDSIGGVQHRSGAIQFAISESASITAQIANYDRAEPTCNQPRSR
jgi:hypothetical protein